MSTKKQPNKYGAICHAGGRRIEITSPHQEWLDWALNALYAVAAKDAKYHAKLKADLNRKPIEAAS